MLKPRRIRLPGSCRRPGGFNHDGTTDILWRNTATGEIISWTMQNGNVVGGASYWAHSRAWQVQATVDFNGDGTADIHWRNISSGEVTAWIMQMGEVTSWLMPLG